MKYKSSPAFTRCKIKDRICKNYASQYPKITRSLFGMLHVVRCILIKSLMHLTMFKPREIQEVRVKKEVGKHLQII